jgi:type I restriction enzyme M protein
VPRKPKSTDANGSNGANLGFEQKLWATADKMRGHMDAAEYKHVALGLIFLKYISDAFEERRQVLLKDKYADPEERDEYTAENVFWVPKQARWDFLQKNAKQVNIGKVIMTRWSPSRRTTRSSRASCRRNMPVLHSISSALVS